MKNVSDLKVMIVDDVSSFREILAKILKGHGVKKIFEADNGHSAWDKIVLESKGNEEFSLVISDINMPVMNGMDLLRNIRDYSRTAKVPFVLVSTENEKNVILQAVLLGIEDYLLKPYDEELANKKLLSVLNKILS